VQNEGRQTRKRGDLSRGRAALTGTEGWRFGVGSDVKLDFLSRRDEEELELEVERNRRLEKPGSPRPRLASARGTPPYLPVP
jgi:hypothetical protein